MKNKQLTVKELSKIITEARDVFSNSVCEDVLKRNNIFDKNFLKRTYETIDFKDMVVQECSCGHKEVIGDSGNYYYHKLLKRCPKCGGYTDYNVMIAKVIEGENYKLVGYVINIVNPNGHMVKYCQIIAFSGKNIVVYKPETSTRISYHIPTIEEKLKLMNNDLTVFSNEEDSRNILISEGDAVNTLKEVGALLKERELISKQTVKKESPREILRKDTCKFITNVKATIHLDYSIAIKKNKQELLILENGKSKIVEFEEDLSIPSWRRNSQVINKKTGEPIKVLNISKFYNNIQYEYAKVIFSIDVNNNLTGAIFAPYVKLKESISAELEKIVEIEVNPVYVLGFVFLNGKFVWVNENGKTVRSYVHHFNSVLFDDDNLKESISKSNQNTPDIQFCLDSSITRYDNKNIFCINKFVDKVKSLFKYPVIESLYKTGFKNLAAELENGYNDKPKFEDAKSIYDILGFKNKTLVKKLAEINPSLSLVETVSSIFQEDNNHSSIEEIIELSNISEYNINTAISCLKFTKTASKLNAYLENVLNYQCIQKREALGILADYYRMADLLKYNMKDKNVLFPSSLKKEHDIATFSYNAIAKELEKEEFAKAIEEYKHLEYSNKKLGMIIVVPSEPADVIGEGKSLHHCVASYVSAVKNRKTQIVFIRTVDEPEKSFYTVEVKDNFIVQVRGLQNCAPTAEVKNFIVAWAKNKGLKTRY